jgi:hypothetical protein
VINACRGVRAEVLGDPCAAGDAADDAGGAVPVKPPPVRGGEQRPFGALADRQVDRPGGARRQRDGHHLPALAGDHQGAVPALEAQVLDVRPVASDTRERCPQRKPRDDDGLHHDP